MTPQIRITIAFRDCRTSVEVWPLRESATALRYLAAMERAHGGSIESASAEVSCDCDAWHPYDVAKAECCGEIVCPEAPEHDCGDDPPDPHWRGALTF